MPLPNLLPLWSRCQCLPLPGPLPSPSLPIPRSQENQLRAQQWMQKLHDQLGLQHFLRDCHEGDKCSQGEMGGGDAPSKWVAVRCSLSAARRRAELGRNAHAPQIPARLRGLWGGEREGPLAPLAPLATARVRDNGSRGDER
ncbi:Hypothetical predicted protein [Marmota monax]|uniref:Uncharacterized protein n=1 Tax=Marmota monax TaxID=9995 RepID=A0A5E4AHV3_MARMO|nr:Hypothetical predicted protein [Marmota monax]